jgi:hypothetical protein
MIEEKNLLKIYRLICSETPNDTICDSHTHHSSPQCHYTYLLTYVRS